MNNLKRLTLFWSCFICAVGILISFHLRCEFQRRAASESLLRIAERRLAPIKYMQQESESLENDLEVLAADRLLPTGQRKSVALILAKVLSQVKLSKQKLSVEKVSLARLEGDQFTMKVSGVGTSTIVVQQLVERLTNEKIFRSVSLASNQEWNASGIVVRKYVLTCQL